VSNPDGLIGDISAKRRWHEHFSRPKLQRLLTVAGFSVIDFDGTGFFGRIIGNVGHFLKWFKPAQRTFAGFQNIDNRLFESTNLFCVAEKSHSL
jgi:hypothetical protein